VPVLVRPAAPAEYDALRSRPVPTGLVVRLAEPDEYAAVGELTVAAYRDAGFLSGDFDYVDELRDAASRGGHADLLVAVPEGAAHPDPAGTVTFCRPGSRYAELSVDGEAEFRMLAVDSRFRGRGVGETLVRACAARARAGGCRRLVCCSRPDMHTAQRLYDRLGFARAPDLDWEPVPGFLLLGYALEL
jgi:ribosomal protein S18 acetylase RimI-like enzyme